MRVTNTVGITACFCLLFSSGKCELNIVAMVLHTMHNLASWKTLNEGHEPGRKRIWGKMKERRKLWNYGGQIVCALLFFPSARFCSALVFFVWDSQIARTLHFIAMVYDSFTAQLYCTLVCVYTFGSCAWANEYRNHIDAQHNFVGDGLHSFDNPYDMRWKKRAISMTKTEETREKKINCEKPQPDRAFFIHIQHQSIDRSLKKTAYDIAFIEIKTFWLVPSRWWTTDETWILNSTWYKKYRFVYRFDDRKPKWRLQ